MSLVIRVRALPPRGDFCLLWSNDVLFDVARNQNGDVQIGGVPVPIKLPVAAKVRSELRHQSGQISIPIDIWRQLDVQVETARLFERRRVGAQMRLDLIEEEIS